MRQGWKVCLAMGLLMPALVARAEEYWLKYRISPNVESEIVNISGQGMQLDKKLPADWTAPKGAIDPRAGVLKMAGKGDENHFRVILGRSAAGVPKHDRLWISRDGDWSKVEAIKPGTAKSENQTEFGPITLKLTQTDGETIDYPISMLIYEQAQQDYMSCRVRPACFYEDWIELEGKKHHVALVDTNCNGRFTDSAPSLYESDWLVIDLNDDGRLDSYGRGFKEVFTCGKVVQFGKQLYKLTVASDGASFALDKPDFKMGTIKTTQKDFKLVLFGENGRLAVDAKDGAVQVPCGTYQFVQATLNAPGATEQEGWRLDSQAKDDGKVKITVSEDKPTEFNFGPPLVAVVTDQAGASGEHSFGLTITGAQGEEYQIYNGSNNAQAKLKVQLEGSKEEAKSYDFAYG